MHATLQTYKKSGHLSIHEAMMSSCRRLLHRRTLTLLVKRLARGAVALGEDSRGARWLSPAVSHLCSHRSVSVRTSRRSRDSRYGVRGGFVCVPSSPEFVAPTSSMLRNLRRTTPSAARFPRHRPRCFDVFATPSPLLRRKKHTALIKVRGMSSSHAPIPCS